MSIGNSEDRDMAVFEMGKTMERMLGWPPVEGMRSLLAEGVIDRPLFDELVRLRRIRNDIVVTGHSDEPYDIEELRGYLLQLEAIIGEEPAR